LLKQGAKTFWPNSVRRFQCQKVENSYHKYLETFKPSF
jgi:hypothetical protein